MKIIYRIAIISFLLFISGCTKFNLDQVKESAGYTFQKNGFDIVGYQGYQFGLSYYPGYGGAMVWYTIKKKSNGITYEAALQKWGGEYHIYNLSAIDAIKP